MAAMTTPHGAALSGHRWLAGSGVDTWPKLDRADSSSKELGTGKQLVSTGSWPRDLSVQEPWRSCAQRGRKGSCAREEWRSRGQKLPECFTLSQSRIPATLSPLLRFQPSNIARSQSNVQRLFKSFPFLLELFNVLQVKGPRLGQTQGELVPLYQMFSHSISKNPGRPWDPSGGLQCQKYFIIVLTSLRFFTLVPSQAHSGDVEATGHDEVITVCLWILTFNTFSVLISNTSYNLS